MKHSAFRNYFFALTGFIAIALSGCAGSRNSTGNSRKKIDITLFQINDVYEISPLDRGNVGGMARVATLLKETQQANKNVLSLLAGDFLSPSPIGTLKDTITNERIAGLQMIEVLNSVGLQMTTFGNHEFDESFPLVQRSINASQFDWVSSNVKYNDPASVRRFEKVTNGVTEKIPTTRIVTFHDNGIDVRMGIFALTIATPESGGKKRTEAYDSIMSSAEEAIRELNGKCDFIVALTHLDIQQDRALARRFPEIKLIIGGHEHVRNLEKIGNTIIAKADANAKTVYLHHLRFNTRTKKLKINSNYRDIDNAIPEDSATAALVKNWNKKAQALLERQGFIPCQVIDSLKQPLDGRETLIRFHQCDLGELICNALKNSVDRTVDIGVLNSGSMRVDDQLSGYITQYDIFRILPFSGYIMYLKIPAIVLDSLIRTNVNRTGDGSFLQFSGLSESSGQYFINGHPIMSQPYYLVATNDYLAKGLQVKLENLDDYPDNTPVKLKRQDLPNDIRKIVIEYVKENSRSKIWPTISNLVPCY